LLKVHADHHPPEITGEGIKATHRISAVFIDEDEKKEIGSIEFTVVSVISDHEEINKIYEFWSSKGYNEIPLDIRIILENQLTYDVLLPISFICQKMNLPPLIPPLTFSPRPQIGR